jgi:hypothetical protein
MISRRILRIGIIEYQLNVEGAAKVYNIYKKLFMPETFSLMVIKVTYPRINPQSQR